MTYYIHIEHDDVDCDIYDGTEEVLKQDGEPKPFLSFDDAQREIMTTDLRFATVRITEET